jgi:hypothetical protein
MRRGLVTMHMYVEQRLARDRHEERLRQAREERDAHQIVMLHRMERRRERAERELLHAWQAVDQLRSAMQVGR